jgi:predicted DNA-binding antitoxin AbrB/MazE fold protein
MNQTIPAVIENGIIRPLSDIELTNGEEVEVIILPRGHVTAHRAKQVLSEIAELPLEGGSDEFSGGDHDELLYPIVLRAS